MLSKTTHPLYLPGLTTKDPALRYAVLRANDGNHLPGQYGAMVPVHQDTVHLQHQPAVQFGRKKTYLEQLPPEYIRDFETNVTTVSQTMAQDMGIPEHCMPIAVILRNPKSNTASTGWYYDRYHLVKFSPTLIVQEDSDQVEVIAHEFAHSDYGLLRSQLLLEKPEMYRASLLEAIERFILAPDHPNWITEGNRKTVTMGDLSQFHFIGQDYSDEEVGDYIEFARQKSQHVIPWMSTESSHQVTALVRDILESIPFDPDHPTLEIWPKITDPEFKDFYLKIESLAQELPELTTGVFGGRLLPFVRTQHLMGIINAALILYAVGLNPDINDIHPDVLKELAPLPAMTPDRIEKAKEAVLLFPDVFYSVMLLQGQQYRWRYKRAQQFYHHYGGEEQLTRLRSAQYCLNHLTLDNHEKTYYEQRVKKLEKHYQETKQKKDTAYTEYQHYLHVQ